MEMMYRLFNSIFWIVATGLVGYTLMLAVTPNPNQMRKKFPETNLKCYKAERDRNITFMKVLKEAAETDEPIYKKKPTSN